ncbi:hypothetical protein B0J13DRAFT_679435 [Dactylonectria estremocensis]|uniref:Transmembrane protein n=1 Tax=Dactylonectria estremocensis TaxID=1079267 RepID=A0A9P9IQW4_9HYPO|nr:hypothetical protein B0J13DRAFT_679435 [Dactylonectria estremocensis]
MDSGTWADPGKGPDSHRDATLHVTRDEIRALVREEMLATAAEAESEPMLPSYESSVPLLPADPNAPPVSHIDTESGQQSPEARKDTNRRWITEISSCLQVIFITGAMIGMTYVCISGYDTAALSFLSFLLVLVQYGVILVVIMAAYFIGGGAKGTNETRPNAPDEGSSNEGLMAFTCHFFLSWMAFFLGVWLWLRGPLLSRAELAAAFDAHITQQDALANLTACITDKVTNQTRNATIGDFTYCLSKLGMAEIPLM